jgi:hypothetical protein
MRKYLTLQYSFYLYTLYGPPLLTGYRTEKYCFLWCTNWIYICYVEESRPPLWSSSQEFLATDPEFRVPFCRYYIFREVVGLARGPLSLVSTIEELLGRKSSGSCLESREYGRRDPSRWPCGTLCPQKLALTSPTSDGRSVGIVRSRTQATEFSFSVFYIVLNLNGVIPWRWLHSRNM